MDNYNSKTYLLAIRRDNNDYLPLEFNLTENYQGENLTTLDGIDQFTKRLEDYELVDEILNANIVDPEEKYQSFVIIYKEKNKYRELKEGPIFRKDENVLNFDYIVRCIVTLLDNKDFINHLYNLKDKFEDSNSLEFIYLIRNSDYLYQVTDKPFGLLKSLFDSMSYEDRRYIANIVYNKINSIKNSKNNVTLKKNVA